MNFIDRYSALKAGSYEFGDFPSCQDDCWDNNDDFFHCGNVTNNEFFDTICFLNSSKL